MNGPPDSLDPHPDDVHKTDPIDRPLSFWDSAHQETIWDRSKTPRGEDYEQPPTTAVERHRVDVDLPPVRDTNFLSEFIRYKCRSCRERCLIARDTEAARYRECRDCVRLPDLQRELVDHLLPSLHWAADLDLDGRPAVASGGTAERRAPPSGAAGSDPLRVDPEAGAQGPTEGTDPTTAKPQRRLSDSRARTDGGQRE
ncbi:hypothetical protein KY092_09385 [Natronomonas gomsonensis]|jgi:hypothetical protein|uniref:hypothetical protein n=1 Tax=Natronomonas gomsonensis TaxID=1046043 RepID=UPI0020CA7B35|nr:hypothetical protein [Natronomonas gomsonensis]MCY4730767.1 hypothetical protein [Natronomonas gomsonensis]